MQRILRGKTYDTETAKLLGRFTQGDWGDPAGFEERLYESEEGFWFFYAIGGETSPYPTETLKAISRDRGEQWLTNRLEG